MDTAIRVEGLCKNYGGFRLKEMSFLLPRGAIMGFIGENGAGKTTTIDCILNLRKKDGGTITVLDRDHVQEEKAIKEEIGVVMDESRFHDNLTPQNINMMMKHIYRNWEERTYFSYLERFRLPVRQKVKQFSKGMSMKLSIAVALSHRAKLLILDEATSGLDPVIRSEILDLFLEFIQVEENSIFLSSHITSDLERVADYITFIHQGEIVLSEQKDVLLEDYGILRGTREDMAWVEGGHIVGMREHGFGVDFLIRGKKDLAEQNREAVIDSVTLEDIMVYTTRGHVS